MAEVFEELKSRFDYVVIDSPPSIPFSDAREISRLVDVVLLVALCGLTTQRAITRCAEGLQEIGANILGVVVNGMDFSSPDYRYYNFGHSSAKLQGRKRMSSCWRRMSSQPSLQAPVEPGNAKM